MTNSIDILGFKMREHIRWVENTISLTGNVMTSLKRTPPDRFMIHQSIHHYVMDSLVNDNQFNLYASLVDSIARSLNLARCTVDKIMRNASYKDTSSVLQNLTVSIEDNTDEYTVSVSDISGTILKRYLYLANPEQGAHLVLRYYPLMGSIYELCLPDNLYSTIIPLINLTSIECFANPTSYSAKFICTPHREDLELTYPNGTVNLGSWFDYIKLETNNTSSSTVNFLFYPPCTDLYVKTSIRLLIDHLSVVKSTFVAFLPVWTNCKEIDELVAIPNTLTTIVKAGEYQLLDLSSNRYVPGMYDMQFVINLIDGERTVNIMELCLRLIKI